MFGPCAPPFTHVPLQLPTGLLTVAFHIFCQEEGRNFKLMLEYLTELKGAFPDFFLNSRVGDCRLKGKHDLSPARKLYEYLRWGPSPARTHKHTRPRVRFR